MNDYHSDRDFISRSDLVVFATSRKAFKRRRERPTVQESDALTIGKGTHAIALRDTIELNKVVEIPSSALSKGGQRRGNAFTRFRLRSENRGKTLMLPAQWDLCQRIADSISRVQIADTDEGKPITVSELLTNPNVEREFEFRWNDIVPCRLKADIVLELPNVVLCIDLKTARSIDEREFRREIIRRKLWLQVAHYSAGLEVRFGKPVRFVFLAVEKTDPHEADMFELDPEAVERAAAGRRVLLESLKGCLETGIFDDPPKRGIKVIGLTAAEMGIAV